MSHDFSRRDLLKLMVAAGLVSVLPSYALSGKQPNAHIVIVGVGTAGLAVANRLAKLMDKAQITLVGEQRTHLYQPGLTLVAGGLWDASKLNSTTESWLDSRVRWLPYQVSEFDPVSNKVILSNQQALSYDVLVVATGCQMNYQHIEGMSKDLIGQHGIASMYAGGEGARRTYEVIQRFITNKDSKALFTLPNTPLKCAGAPLKMTFIALDFFERSGHREAIDVAFYTPYQNKRIFSVPYYNDFVLQRWDAQNVTVSDERLLVAIDPGARQAHYKLTTGQSETVDYDMIHVVPPMSAPDAVKDSELVWQTGDFTGNWVEVNAHSLQHLRFPNVFALGDVIGTPLGKTAASIKKQAPVVVANILAYLNDQNLEHDYDGYTSCPLITGIGKAILAEFDYKKNLTPSFPFISPKDESWFVWMLEEKMLQGAYYAVLKGQI